MLHKKWVQIAVLVVYFFVNPMIAIRGYYLKYLAGDYPSTSDSLGLPVVSYVVFWGLVGSPILAVLIYMILRSDKVNRSLAEFNWERPLLSFSVSILVVFLVAWNIFFFIEEVGQIDWVTTLYVLLEIYVFLMVRVLLIFGGRKAAQE